MGEEKEEGVGYIFQKPTDLPAADENMANLSKKEGKENSIDDDNTNKEQDFRALLVFIQLKSAKLGKSRAKITNKSSEFTAGDDQSVLRTKIRIENDRAQHVDNLMR